MAALVHVLLISGEYPPAVGGVGAYTRQLGRALIVRGLRVTVLADDAAAAQPRDVDEPPAIAFGPRWDWPALLRALRIVRAVQPDFVHLQYQSGAYRQHPAIMLLPRALRLLPHQPGVLVTAHDLRLPYLFPKADAVRTMLTCALLGAADAVIVTNADDARRLAGSDAHDRELYEPRRALATPLWTIPIGSNIAPQPPDGYERAAWRSRLGIGPDDVLLLYFGLLNRSKGVAELLHALALLPARFRLLIVGGAAPLPDDQRYAAEIKSLLTELGLRERVQITGPCDDAEVSAHLLAGDLAVQLFADGASYRRGSLLAALAHGVPTITTAPPTPLDPPLRDGIEARLLPNLDPAALARAIRQLADDQALQGALATGGAALATYFGWASIAEQHESVYHTVAAGRRRTRADA